MSIHDGHRERLRRRFVREGIASFSDHNILELLLFFSKPMGDTNPTAHRLIERFGSLSGVMDAPVEELCKVNGIGESSAVLIKFMRELSKIYAEDAVKDGTIFCSTTDFIKYTLRFYADKSKNRVSIVFVDGKRKVIGHHIIEGKSIVEANRDKRELLECIMKYNTINVVIAYNNHSDEAVPSSEEVKAMKEIYALLKSIGMIVIDYIMFSRYESMSIRSAFTWPLE